MFHIRLLLPGGIQHTGPTLYRQLPFIAEETEEYKGVVCESARYQGPVAIPSNLSASKSYQQQLAGARRGRTRFEQDCAENNDFVPAGMAILAVRMAAKRKGKNGLVL
jgi:hypothetical protein